MGYFRNKTKNVAFCICLPVFLTLLHDLSPHLTLDPGSSWVNRFYMKIKGNTFCVVLAVSSEEWGLRLSQLLWLISSCALCQGPLVPPLLEAHFPVVTSWLERQQWRGTWKEAQGRVCVTNDSRTLEIGIGELLKSDSKGNFAWNTTMNMLKI